MVTIKSSQEIEDMKRGGQILASVLDVVVKAVRPGITTAELDLLAEKHIQQAGCKAAFKNYQSQKGDPPFPGTLCTSVNDEVVHGIPGKRVLRAGDIIGLDIGLWYPGQLREYVLDMARTVPVGSVSHNAKRLLKTTEKALLAGIRAVRPGNYVHDISYAIQEVLLKERLGIVRDLCGHGVGYELHEDPYVLNHVAGKNMGSPIKLQTGMVLAIEPMATLGGFEVMLDDDGWTVRTADESLAAQFEHTVAVSQTGYDVLTQFEHT